MLQVLCAAVVFILPASGFARDFDWSNSPKEILSTFGTPEEYKEKYFSDHIFDLRAGRIDKRDSECSIDNIQYTPWRGPGPYETSSVTFSFHPQSCRLGKVIFFSITSSRDRGEDKNEASHVYFSLMEGLQKKYGTPKKSKRSIDAGKNGILENIKGEKALINEGYVYREDVWSVPDDRSIVVLKVVPSHLIDDEWDVYINMEYVSIEYAEYAYDKEVESGERPPSLHDDL